MKKAYSHLLFAGILFLSGCSQREASPSERSYFIGSWKLNSPVAAGPNPVQTVLTFHKEGKLTLNVKFEGATEPDRKWSFDENSDELRLYVPLVENYRLVEKTKDHFKAKNVETSSILLFTRQ